MAVRNTGEPASWSAAIKLIEIIQFRIMRMLSKLGTEFGYSLKLTEGFIWQKDLKEKSLAGCQQSQRIY